MQKAVTASSSRERIAATKHILASIDNFETDYDVSALEIARLRLIGIGWKSTGLSEMTIGTHDANLIYRQLDSASITVPERIGLIDCGLAHITSQNAPLWKWVYEDSDQIRSIRIDAIFSADDSIKSGAFNFLGLIDDDFDDFREYLKTQFTEFSSSAKNAALKYIGRLGDSEFLDTCLNELTKSDPSTLNEALLAILSIKARDSASDALVYLIDENRFPSGEWRSRDTVVKSMTELSDNVVERGASHRDADVRAMAVRVLATRKPLAPELSSDLRTDPSAKVRMAAVEVALQAGESLSLGDIAKIVVQTETNAFLPKRKVGEEEYSKLREIVFKAMPDDDLESELDSFFTPANVAYSTLLLRHWKQRSKTARANLTDSFVSYFDTIKKSYLARFGETRAESMIPNEGLMEFVASNMIKSTLEVFAKKGDASDIRFFRSAVSSKYYIIQPSALAFFGKHGEWSDIMLIASATRSTGMGLFSDSTVSNDELAVTIRKIAGQRLLECIQLDIDFGIKSAIIKNYPQNAFRSLSNEAIISLLNEVNDEMRKWSAVKVCECLSRDRVSVILRQYMDQSYLYYNVIHWLDLKVSAPAHITRLVASRQ